MTLRSLYGYGSSLTRPVTMWLRNREDKRALCRGRQPGDPSGVAALAPLKGELAARTGCLRGFTTLLTDKPLRFLYRSTTSPSRGGRGTSCQRVAKLATPTEYGENRGCVPFNEVHSLSLASLSSSLREGAKVAAPQTITSTPTACAFTSSQFVPAGRAAAGHREVCPPGHPFQKSCHSHRRRQCQCPPPGLHRDR